MALFAAVGDDLQLIAPDFWVIECANALWKRARLRHIDASHAVAALEQLRVSPVTQLNTEHLTGAALVVALECRMTVYDALYVATAQYVDGTLVTADEKLLGALRTADWPVRAVHLAEWS